MQTTFLKSIQQKHQKRTTGKKSAKKRGFGGARVPGGVWGGAPQV